MAVKKLTAAFVREARAEPGKERTVYWDAALPSFGLAVTERGAKSYVIQYRNGRLSRRYTINSVLGLEDARREARAILGQVASSAATSTPCLMTSRTSVGPQWPTRSSPRCGGSAIGTLSETINSERR